MKISKRTEGDKATSKSRKAKRKGKQKWTKQALQELVSTKDNVVIPHQIKQLKSDPHAKISLSKKKLRKLEKAKRRIDREKERMEIESAPSASSSKAKKGSKEVKEPDVMDTA